MFSRRINLDKPPAPPAKVPKFLLGQQLTVIGMPEKYYLVVESYSQQGPSTIIYSLTLKCKAEQEEIVLFNIQMDEDKLSLLPVAQPIPRKNLEIISINQAKITSKNIEALEELTAALLKGKSVIYSYQDTRTQTVVFLMA